MRTSSSAVSYLVKGQIRKPRGGSGPSVAVCSANKETGLDSRDCDGKTELAMGFFEQK